MQIINQTATTRAYLKGHRLFVSQKGTQFRRYQFPENIVEDIVPDLSAMDQETLDRSAEQILTIAQQLNAPTYYQASL